MHAHPISVTKHYSEQSNVKDEIYATLDNWNLNVMQSRLNNDAYKVQDYTLSVYSTMGYGIFKVVHRNNIVTNVRNYLQAKSLASRIENNKNVNGVVIVETYNLNVTSISDVTKYLSYIISRSDIETLDINIEDYMSNFKDKYNINCIPGAPINVRFASFIDIKYFNIKSSLYVKDYDIVITKNNIENLPLHPYSDIAIRQSYMAMAKGNPSNTILIDIVDNSGIVNGEVAKKGVYQSKDYYLRIGNNIEVISSSTNGATEDGATIVIKSKNSDVGKVINISLDELEEYGIYRTYEDAEVSGDHETHIEKKKIELENKKIDLGKLKIEDEYTAREINAKLQTAKIEQEYVKMMYEYKALLNKRTNDYILSVQANIKASFDIESLKQKALIEKYKLTTEKIKHEEAKYKSSSSKFKDTIDIINKTITTGVNIGKTFT